MTGFEPIIVVPDLNRSLRMKSQRAVGLAAGCASSEGW
jgi:hypothetical protein